MVPHDIRRRQHADLSRREILQIGYSGMAGIGLPSLLAGRARGANGAKAGSVAKARSVLLLYMTGAPSHIDTFDPKPDAPAEIRGSFGTIATRIPGVRFCEHLPETAARTQHLAIVRTMTQGEIDHERGSHTMLTGMNELPAGASNTATRRDWPCFSAALDYLRPRRDGIPSGVLLPVYLQGRGGYSGQNAGLLGAKHDPWTVQLNLGNPMAGVEQSQIPVGLRIERARFENRKALLSQLEGQRMSLAAAGPQQEFNAFQQSAFSMLSSGRLASAFSLESEPAAMRERYGNHLFGQSMLLARRVVEAGIPVVQVNLGNTNWWDTHRDNCKILKSSLLPPFDRAFSALLDDMSARGLLDETLVVLSGEFGRTPKMGGNIGSPAFNPDGRDHWTPVFTSVFAGAGVRGGQVIGKSDRIAAFPLTESFYPADLGATIYSALGVDLKSQLRDPQGRPLPLTHGQVIEPLYSAAAV